MTSTTDAFKDPLLRGEFFAFSVDEIFRSNTDYFSLRILPDIKSKFYPPYHTRIINIAPEFLEETFYRTIKKESESLDTRNFVSSVVQGGYYKVPSEILRDKKVFDFDTVLSVHNNIFEGTKAKSPYEEMDIKGDKVFGADDIAKELSKGDINKRLKAVYLYGFNVGQGESLLLVTSNKNAYIIDGNFYNPDKADQFMSEVRSKLIQHKMPPDKIKGLIVTHKHLDHMRGLKYIIERNIFQIEYFFINLDYHHPTRVVFELLNTAKARIKKWINVNQRVSWTEGKTKIDIKNPDSTTCCRSNAPNINDSSVGLCIKYGTSLFFLTGDISYDILQNKFANTYISNNSARILKVSHHGSDTGTDSTLLNYLLPSHAFISAGHSKRYNHPHQPVVSLLEKQIGRHNLFISKLIGKTVCFKANGSSIIGLY
jgi:beta-lactamase superfamily II metal-dependent hydrolase